MAKYCVKHFRNFFQKLSHRETSREVSQTMDSEEFRKCAEKLIDFTIDYTENIRTRRVTPDVQPGFMQKLLPGEAPFEGEPWQNVVNDLEKIIMPGMTHWNSPRFHGYFPAANSYPALCAEIIENALTPIGFSWASAPAVTELEIGMMDWLGQMLNLPEHFLFRSKGTGGGVIQNSSSEATLMALVAARNKALLKIRETHPDFGVDKLVTYTSDQAHICVHKAAILGAVKMNILPTDETLGLRAETLEAAILEDRKKGLIPALLVTTLGTTNTCAFDNLEELGPICVREKMWLHVDAAYAGSSFICPEFRQPMNGIEYVDSFDFNPHKWLLINIDCSAMWMKNVFDLTNVLNLETTYLDHNAKREIPDYRHWQIPLGRRMRSLKMWFVFRIYGVQGLQNYIREHVSLAKLFEKLVSENEDYEIVYPVTLGLVCFRLKGSDLLNEHLIKAINERGRIHLTPATVRGKFIIRFAVCSRLTNSDDIYFAWEEIQTVAREIKS